jgi:hypothetical protein
VKTYQTTLSELIRLASIIHFRHGKGDILSIRIFASGRVEITAKQTSCKPHISVGHCINSKTGRIRLYGKTLSLKTERVR